MVQIQPPNPFGPPDDEDSYQATLVELQRAGRFGVVTPGALRRALEVLRRDSALQRASGRWVIGRPDPAQFVPGDVAAIRKIVGATTLTKSALLDRMRQAWPALGGEVELSRRSAHTMLLELTSAVPYFIPTAATGAVLASRPPAAALLERLRLPFPRVLVLFGADLELDPSAYPWPRRRRPTSGLPHDLVGGMIARGAYLTGMVLLADAHGRLRDDLLWIVAANPDPELPPPASLDRLRGMLRGWRNAATLAPIVDTVAAAVAWGGWQPPAPAPDLPADPDSRLWRKLARRNAFRTRERRGDAVGVHVINLERSLTRAQGSSRRQPEEPGRRASPDPTTGAATAAASASAPATPGTTKSAGSRPCTSTAAGRSWPHPWSSAASPDPPAPSTTSATRSRPRLPIYQLLSRELTPLLVFAGPGPPSELGPTLAGRTRIR